MASSSLISCSTKFLLAFSAQTQSSRTHHTRLRSIQVLSGRQRRGSMCLMVEHLEWCHLWLRKSSHLMLVWNPFRVGLTHSKVDCHWNPAEFQKNRLFKLQTWSRSWSEAWWMAWIVSRASLPLPLMLVRGLGLIVWAHRSQSGRQGAQSIDKSRSLEKLLEMLIWVCHQLQSVCLLWSSKRENPQC